MNTSSAGSRLSKLLLTVYLLVFGMASTAMLVGNFPVLEDGSRGTTCRVNASGFDGGVLWWPGLCLANEAQAMFLLAFVAGMTGSFIHAGQSLATYIGNRDYDGSWGVWYLFRPWIGGILGVVVFAALRAGLMGGGELANPYGVVAIGALAGWFSKTTADKMQEVFETLFRSDVDRERKDKLNAPGAPRIAGITPAPVPASAASLLVAGDGFRVGAVVLLNSTDLPTEFVSATELKASLEQLEHRPDTGSQALVQVRNPDGTHPVSQGLWLEFTS